MPTYQPATLNKPATGTWRYTWYNLHPETKRLERVRNTLNINRVRDLRERGRIAKIYLDNLNEALRNGYNFFTAALGMPAADPPAPEIAVMSANNTEPVITILQALERALKKRTLGRKSRTVTTYKSFVTRLTDWLTEHELHTMPVGQFTADLFQEYLYYKSGEGHGNRNLNDHTNFFKTTFDIIRKDLKLITVSPLADFDFLPESDSTLFAPFTTEELGRIAEALKTYNERFYLFTRFISYAYIRPYHIGQLRAGQIDYNANTISVAGHTTKNKKNSSKQLLKPLKDMLIKMDYHKLPGNYYLFGKNFEPARECYPTLSVRAAEIWKEIVIDGLGINKKMYALKHTSSQYFVNQNPNADIKFLQQQMEHHSMTQTEIYLQGKTTKRINEKKVKVLQY